MKISPLDAHDRYTHFTKQNFNIEECCQDLIDKQPFGTHAFYIFAHARTDDDGVTKRIIWQPRLTKPRAQTNSMLFKAYPGTDRIKIIWMIPSRELWGQYEKGYITQNKIVKESIHDFQFCREKLEAPEDDDLNDSQIDSIYRQIATQKRTKQVISELPQAS